MDTSTNRKINDMDKYYKEARDMEVLGRTKEAKRSKEKAMEYARDANKAFQARAYENKKYAT